MTDHGFDRPLYILPFDHRGSFQSEHVRLEGRAHPAADRRDRRREAGHLRRVPRRRRRRRTEGEGRHPRRRAVRRCDPARRGAQDGFVTARPAEKSGQDEFDFEYGEDFAQHIDPFNPTFCKVLVRYNPDGDSAD